MTDRERTLEAHCVIEILDVMGDRTTERVGASLCTENMGSRSCSFAINAEAWAMLGEPNASKDLMRGYIQYTLTILGASFFTRK